MTRINERPQRLYRRRTLRVMVEYVSDGGLACDPATTLGAGGLFIETETPLIEGTHLKMRFTLPAWPRRDETGKAQPSHGLEHGLHVPVLERGNGSEGLARLDKLVAVEHAAQGGNRFWGQLGEIGQGAGLDLAAFAIALPQQQGGGRGAIGNGGDVHVNIQ